MPTTAADAAATAVPGTTTAEPRPPRFGSQLATLLVLSGLTYIVSLMPVQPNDYWWHLRMGELIASQRQIPVTNMFAWSVPLGSPAVYGGWLAQLLPVPLHALGGVELTVFVRNVLFLATMGLVASRRSAAAGRGG